MTDNDSTTAILYNSPSLEMNTNLPLNEVRVILVGDCGAGKTSLMKRLLGKPFYKNEAQTHGINIDHFWVKQGNKKIKVHVWDFGGQEIMHSTHQFFFSKRSLYILVLDSRKEGKNEYWLKNIRSFSGDSPVLLVLNKIDENPAFDVNRLYLQEKYKNVKGFYRVSCVLGKGIDEFSAALRENLTSMEILQTTWTENWFNVKKRLENMKEHCLHYQQYQQICLEEKVTDPEHQDILMDFLNDLGIILHFKELQLIETSIIEPHWITEAVYKIINSEKLNNSRGVLELKLLGEILKQKKMTDFYYSRDKYRYIIELMKKFELCFEIDSKKVLIPDLLGVQEMKLDFHYPSSLKIIFKYDFLPRSVMPRFAVRMHNDIKDRYCWRTGIFLESNAFHACAVVKADHEDKKISVYVNGEQRKDYFAVIRYIIKEINNNFETIQIDERVPMPDDPQVTVSYDHLLRLERMGTIFYVPEFAKRAYNVKVLLGIVDMEKKEESMARLRYEFLRLSEEKPHKRGFDFERFLKQLFDHYDLDPRASFRNIGEQIDGSFQIGNDVFLVEAKWYSKPVAMDDLAIFHEKVRCKAMGTRGLFISISGFSKEAIEAFTKGRSTAIIGMDARDLEYILDGKLTLAEALKLKLRHASETNEFYTPLAVLFSIYR